MHRTKKRNLFKTQKHEPLSSLDNSTIEKLTYNTRTIKELMTKINYKMNTEYKVPIIILTGVPSSGKTFFANIIGEALGNVCHLKSIQLKDDNMICEEICRHYATIAIFEEMQFMGYEPKDVGKITEILKDLTSGNEKSGRRAMNRGNKAIDGDDYYKLDAIIITTNTSQNYISEYLYDPGLQDRLIYHDFKTKLDVNERINPKDLYGYVKLAMVKYAKSLLNKS